MGSNISLDSNPDINKIINNKNNWFFFMVKLLNLYRNFALKFIDYIINWIEK
jgi:hypothetical protein